MRLLTGPFQMIRVETDGGIAATFGGGGRHNEGPKTSGQAQNAPAMTLAKSVNIEANDTK